MSEFTFGLGAVHPDAPHEVQRAEALGISVEPVSFSADSVAKALSIATDVREKSSRSGDSFGAPRDEENHRFASYDDKEIK